MKSVNEEAIKQGKIKRMKKFGIGISIVLTALFSAIAILWVLTLKNESLGMYIDWLIAAANLVVIIFTIALNEFIKSSDTEKKMKIFRGILWCALLVNMGGLASFIVENWWVA